MSPSDPAIPTLPPLPATVKAGRIPRWPPDGLRHRPCPVCQADEPQPICRRPDQLVVVRCRCCSLTYLAEIPTEAALRAFYENYGEYKGLEPPPPPWWQRCLPWRRPDPFVEILLQTGGLAGQRVCEVGCTYGYFLRKCQRWQAAVTGVEWDDRAIAYLGRLGISASRTMPAGATFDVVCAFQLIEHLSDPQGFLAEVAGHLAPDGRLLIATPNGGEADRVGPGWIGFRLDLEHLNYFSSRSLATGLRQHGLYLEQVWEYMQADLPRPGAPAVRRGRLAGLVSTLYNRIGYGPFHRDGTYILCALARKAAAS